MPCPLPLGAHAGRLSLPTFATLGVLTPAEQQWDILPTARCNGMKINPDQEESGDVYKPKIHR